MQATTAQDKKGIFMTETPHKMWKNFARQVNISNQEENGRNPAKNRYHDRLGVSIQSSKPSSQEQLIGRGTRKL
jgi:hypothetical protein